MEAHLTPLPLRADGFGSGETIINLFEKANLSTFLHETGHYFLAVTEALASSQKATPEIHSMLEAVQTWWRDNAADVAKDASSGVSVSDVQIYFNEGTTGNSDKDAAIETGKHEQFAKRAL
nr:hypothetical protein [uncultured Cohaesibacter sp.]